MHLTCHRASILKEMRPISHLFGIRVCTETGVKNFRSRISGAPLRLEEAFGLG